MANTELNEKVLNPPQAPPLFNGTKESILEDVKSTINEHRAFLDNISKSFTPATATFKEVMEAMARKEDETASHLRILIFYQHVSADSEVRDSSSKAQQLLEDFSIENLMREDIFRLVDALHQKRDSLGLDLESLRLLEKSRKGYISSGLGLPAGPERQRFKDIKTRLSTLAIEYSKNLNEENESLWLTPEELKGVPSDIVSSLDKGSNENEGKLRLTFKYPQLFPTLKYAIDPETRKRVFIASENRV